MTRIPFKMKGFPEQAGVSPKKELTKEDAIKKRKAKKVKELVRYWKKKKSSKKNS
jgi:hypothetical protein